MSTRTSKKALLTFMLVDIPNAILTGSIQPEKGPDSHLHFLNTVEVVFK